MYQRAAKVHADRNSVVVDGTFSTGHELRRGNCLAIDPRSVFLAVECFCRPEVARERIRRRMEEGRDASDARPEVHEIQRTRWEAWPADISQVRINTEQPLPTQVEQVLAALRATDTGWAT
jgi:predicted kinase